MSPVVDTLAGLSVIDLSHGSAGPIATMLLADNGAEVLRLVPPSGDPFACEASVVWDRGKQRRVADLATDVGRAELMTRLQTADVLVDSFSPRTRARFGLGAGLAAAHPRLVHCSITGYGSSGRLCDRPGYDALVQARTGVMFEQPGHRDGPIFHWSPLPSYGAGLLAACGILAALAEREGSGLGQRVETSLLQGVLLWTTMPWTRVERPSPGYYATYGCRDVMPTPSYEAGDGSWIHPMPEVVPIVLEALGLTPDHLAGSQMGSCDDRKAWQASLQELLRRRTSDEWLELFWSRDVRCQPVLSIDEAYDHPQLAAIGAVDERIVDNLKVRQLGVPFRVTHREGSAPARSSTTRRSAPLEGITVLDFGLAVAGPYAPMLLSDLGADVIRVDNVNAPRATDNQIWAACQRGKRSITLDLKSDEGRAVVAQLVSTCDVIHHNMRPGVAERLGIGYEAVRRVNSGIIYCHVTGFGAVGPLALFPGSDQMSQAISGLEHEQGAVGAGGHPTWNRLGMCDHAAAVLSVLGTVGALYRRERTGEGALVEASISGAAVFLASHVALGDGVIRFPSLDGQQTGLGPLYRLYRTADGWLCLAAVRARHWRALCSAIGLPQLVDDVRFADEAARRANADALGARLEAAFSARSAEDWFAVLDAAAVPAEIASDDFITDWFDDPDLVERGLVTKYEHRRWGRTEQVGLLWDLSATPARIYGPPVMHGQHSAEILTELGYAASDIERLAAARVTSIPEP